MNFHLSQMPDRLTKPRSSGITMVMDKGLSIPEIHQFMSICRPHVDIVKLGFGTSYVTPDLRQKIETYQSYDIPVYFGGTVDRSTGSKALVYDVIAGGGYAVHMSQRASCGEALVTEARPGDRVLVLGARDDTLTEFARDVLAGLG